MSGSIYFSSKNLNWWIQAHTLWIACFFIHLLPFSIPYAVCEEHTLLEIKFYLFNEFILLEPF